MANCNDGYWSIYDGSEQGGQRNEQQSHQRYHEARFESGHFAGDGVRVDRTEVTAVKWVAVSSH